MQRFKGRTDATDDELAAGPRAAESGDLDDDADDEDDGAREHHLLAAEAVAEHESEDGTTCTTRRESAHARDGRARARRHAPRQPIS